MDCHYLDEGRRDGFDVGFKRKIVVLWDRIQKTFAYDGCVSRGKR